MNAAARSVDYIARLAEAWNLEGRHPFDISRREHRALLVMAGLDLRLQGRLWHTLEAYQRQALFAAARDGVTLGRACAWVFGEGQGA
jgi:hypothetical protein